MTKPDQNSPEAMLAATRKELEFAKAELATLKASAAPEASATLKAELATAKNETARLQAALASANARLAAKGEAPALTISEQIKARSAEMTAKAKADALAAKLAAFDAKRFLSAEDKAELLGMMAALPQSEQRNFWTAHLRGK